MSKKPNNWAGSDVLTGTARNDVLRGQGGDDLLTGGRGSDVFRFEATRSLNGFDTITDYTWAAGKKAEADILDLSAVRLTGARKDSIGDYVWLTEGRSGATLYVDRDGPGGSAPEAWAFLEALAAGDRVQVRLDASSACSSADASENHLLTVRRATDAIAPTFGGQTLIEVKYDENRQAGDVLGTLAATDNVLVTGYRFCDSNGNGLGATSPDGFFSIGDDGTIRMTAAGAASPVVNDYEGGPPPPSYFLQAGDAAGNWSAPQPVALLAQDVLEAQLSVEATPFYDAEGKPTAVPKASGLEFEANVAGIVALADLELVPMYDYTNAGTRVLIGERVTAVQGALALCKPGTTDFSAPAVYPSLLWFAGEPGYASTQYGLGSSAGDVLSGDFVWGFGGDDTLSAMQSSGTTNYLFGGAGNDTLLGYSTARESDGPTVLVGGAGVDRIFPGNSTDGTASTVVFDADAFGSLGGPDQIVDFTVLESSGFSWSKLAIDAPLKNSAGGDLTDGVSAEEWHQITADEYAGVYQLTGKQMVLEVHKALLGNPVVPGSNSLKDAGKQQILELLGQVSLAAPGDEALLVLYQDGDWVDGSYVGLQNLTYLFHMKDSGSGGDGSLTMADTGDVIELVGVLTGVYVTWLGPENFVASPFAA